MLSGHNASSYGLEFDSWEGLWGLHFFCWLQLTSFPFARPLVGAPSFCIKLWRGIRHNRIQQLHCSIQCIFIIIYLYYHKSWKVSQWATLYYVGPWRNTQQNTDMLRFYIKRQQRDYGSKCNDTVLLWYALALIYLQYNCCLVGLLEASQYIKLLRKK